MTQGDVVIINFPFSDLTATKARPALVVSNDAHNDCDDDRIFVLISSNPRVRSEADLPILPTDSDFRLSGLKCASVLRCSKLVHLDGTKLRAKRLGRLGEVWVGRVADTISDVVHPAARP